MPDLFAPSERSFVRSAAPASNVVSPPPSTPVLPTLGRAPSALETIEIPRGFDPADPFVCSFRVAAWIIQTAPDAAAFEAALVECRQTIDAVERGQRPLWERLRRMAHARRQGFAG